MNNTDWEIGEARGTYTWGKCWHELLGCSICVKREKKGERKEWFLANILKAACKCAQEISKEKKKKKKTTHRTCNFVFCLKSC